MSLAPTAPLVEVRTVAVVTFTASVAASEQVVAAVEQVVRLVAVRLELLDSGVQLGDLVCGRNHVAARAGEGRVLGRGLRLHGGELGVDALERGGEVLALVDERLAGGHVV